MAFAATDSTVESRAISLGPVKLQVLTFSVASGDTTGTVTCDRLSRVMHILVDGSLKFTAAPTYATNVATLAFADPGATVYGTIIAVGI
jgi:hypothetical protein